MILLAFLSLTRQRRARGGYHILSGKPTVLLLSDCLPKLHLEQIKSHRQLEDALRANHSVQRENPRSHPLFPGCAFFVTHEKALVARYTYGGQMKKVMVKNGNSVAARSNYLRSAWQ